MKNTNRLLLEWFPFSCLVRLRPHQNSFLAMMQITAKHWTWAHMTWFVFTQPFLSSASCYFLHSSNCSLPAFISLLLCVSSIFPLHSFFPSFRHPLFLLIPLSPPSHHSFRSVLHHPLWTPSLSSFILCLPPQTTLVLSLLEMLHSFGVPLSETQLPPLFLYAWYITHAKVCFPQLSQWLSSNCDSHPFTGFLQNDIYLCNL